MSTETMTAEVSLADELVRSLPNLPAAEIVGEDSHSVRFRVRQAGWKLATIVFSKRALRKLLNDPTRDVKVEYLRRDILSSALRRVSYSYPRRGSAFSI